MYSFEGDFREHEMKTKFFWSSRCPGMFSLVKTFICSSLVTILRNFIQRYCSWLVSFSKYNPLGLVTHRRSSPQWVFCHKGVLKISQNSQENLTWGLRCRSEAFNFNKKKIISQVFPCEFCKLFKNTFFIVLELFKSINTFYSFWHW